MKRSFLHSSVFSPGLLISDAWSVRSTLSRRVPMAPAFKEQPPESFKELTAGSRLNQAINSFAVNWWEIFGDPS